MHKKKKKKKKRELGIGCNDKVGLHVLSLALITPDLEQRIKSRCRPLLSFVTLKSWATIRSTTYSLRTGAKLIILIYRSQSMNNELNLILINAKFSF